MCDYAQKLEAENKRMSEELATIRLYEEKEVWFWDTTDDVEQAKSLTCPIVIPARILKMLITASEAAGFNRMLEITNKGNDTNERIQTTPG